MSPLLILTPGSGVGIGVGVGGIVGVGGTFTVGVKVGKAGFSNRSNLHPNAEINNAKRIKRGRLFFIFRHYNAG
jgi:hypothetical protein